MNHYTYFLYCWAWFKSKKTTNAKLTEDKLIRMFFILHTQTNATDNYKESVFQLNLIKILNPINLYKQAKRDQTTHQLVQ